MVALRKAPTTRVFQDLYVRLVSEATNEAKAFSSACHGAGRALSRHEALRRWRGRKIVDDLAANGIQIRSRSSRVVAEEAPGA